MLDHPEVLLSARKERSQTLTAYRDSHTSGDSNLDNLVKLATQILSMPFAFISLMDDDRQWVISSTAGSRPDIEREKTICKDTVLQHGVFEVQDIATDSRYADFYLPDNAASLRYYAGVPVLDTTGAVVGTFCVLDSSPRCMTSEQKDIFLNLAKQASALLTLQFTYGRDITNSRKVENELRKLSFVASKVNNAVVINDADNCVIWVNAAFEKITGFTFEDVKGRRLGDLITGPKTDFELIDEVRRLTAKRQSFTIDMLAYRKDKKEIWISVYNTVVLDESGNVDAEVEIIIDITEKKKAEEEFQVLSLVASKTDTGVSIQDKDGKTTWVNRSLESMTGYTLNELRGHQMGNILSPNFDDQELIRTARNKSKNRQSYSIEVLGEKKDGTPIWFSVSNTPILNSRGDVDRQIDLISDITQRKQVEMEIIEAKEQALKLSQAKEMFLSVMSHEIRTPLNAVIGMTHLLLDNDPKPSQIEDLNILKFSGENLLHIINDILDFTKIETGKLEIEIMPFDLRMLANDIVNSLQVNVKKNENELLLIVDDRIPVQLLGDKNRLYQILVNLLGNAIKFTTRGLVQLKIQLNEESLNDLILTFEVQDNGIGIPLDKQRYIFETFTQAKTHISRKYGGTGLGLAITKKLLNMFGADIKVDSTEGVGTTFSFDLRFRKTMGQTQIHGADTGHTGFAGRKILVVDDNELNILIARRILSKWGLEIDSAVSGYEAIDKILEKRYDLVLMDIKMPGIDGFETAGMIRDMGDPAYKSLPIIALTASTLKNDHIKFKKCGMNGHVLKPFDPEEIKTLLSKFLVRDN